MFQFLLKTDDSQAQLFTRAALGAVILPHGLQKILGIWGGPGLERTMQIFMAKGYPNWAVILLMVTESLGALLLAAGFLTRIWALGIGTAMAICMYTNHLQYGFFLNWTGSQQGEGIEFHILVISIALALVFRGGGRLSLDRKFSGGR